MSDKGKVKKENGNAHTRVMRVHKRVYAELTKLKELYAEKNGLEAVSFSEFLTECVAIGELLLAGEELYEVNGQLFKELESARGESIVAAIKAKKTPVPPSILLRVGKDPLLKDVV